jgi:hypothetical protein
VGRTTRGTAPFLFILIALGAAPARAQSLARFSLDSAVAVDVFRGQNAADRPNIVIDVTAVVRLADGWLFYIRPWFRQPRTPEWDKEIYQAALQYTRNGRISTRVDAGYLVSPIGLGMLDTRPGINPVIGPHFSYVQSLPTFDPGSPRVTPLASSYPLGSQLTVSTDAWDVRAAVVNSAPTRQYVINNSGTNPKATPVLVAGGGITPRVGLRFGLAFAHGLYATSEETTRKPPDDRSVSLWNVEGEWSFGYTKVSGEVTRDRFQTLAGTETAYGWFVQAQQTLTPRFFVAARQEGASAPPLRTGVAVGARSLMQVTEATIGYRLNTDITFRGSFQSRKPFTRQAWDQQAGVSVVWAHRWW